MLAQIKPGDQISILICAVRMMTGKDAVEDGKKTPLFNITMEVMAFIKGGRGCMLYGRNEKADVDAYKIVQADPKGAGDRFDATLLCALIKGRSLRVGRMASAAANLQ